MSWMKKSVIILFSFIASLASTAMLISGSFDLNCFYNVGEICHYPDSQYVGMQGDNGYCDVHGKVTVTGEQYGINIYTDTVQRKFEYICIDIEELNRESVELRAEYYDGSVSSAVQKHELYTIYDGENYIYTGGQDFNAVKFYIENQQGVSFVIKSIQAREKLSDFNAKEFVLYVVIFFGVYLLGGLLIFKTKIAKIMEKILDKTVDTLQDIYICIGNNFINICPPIIKKYRNILNILVFSGMMLYMNLIEDIGKYAKYLEFHLLFYAICLLLITVMYIDSELKRQNWKNGLVYSWMIYWILVCISDYKVDKQYQFVGYIGIFVIGFFIFVWNNCRDRGVILHNFIKAVQLYFWICYVACVFFRPLHEGQRYLGISWNPIIFATCMITVFAVVLAELDNCLLGKDSKKKIWLYAFELGCVVELIWETQSVGPMLTCFLIALIWMARVSVHSKKMQIKTNYFRCISLIIMMTVGALLTKIMISVVPVLLGTEITLKKDVYSIASRIDTTLTVYASDLINSVKDTRLYNKLFESRSISTLLSGRNYYYEAYIRQMNLWGHKGWAKMLGREYLPHNALLSIAYKYGVFTVIPYLYMLIYTLKRAYKKIFEDQRYSFVFFSISFTTIVMSMADNVERPFIWCTWLALYILMGGLFCNKDN